jgi:hypothetical protein
MQAGMGILYSSSRLSVSRNRQMTVCTACQRDKGETGSLRLTLSRFENQMQSADDAMANAAVATTAGGVRSSRRVPDEFPRCWLLRAAVKLSPRYAEANQDLSA